MANYRLCALGVLLVTSTIGCSSNLMHELQPHRLWRLNRGPAPGNGAMYSIAPEQLSDMDVLTDSSEQPNQL